MRGCRGHFAMILSQVKGKERYQYVVLNYEIWS